MLEIGFADRLKPAAWRLIGLLLALILVCLCTVVIIALAKGLSEQKNSAVSLQQGQTAVTTHTHYSIAIYTQCHKHTCGSVWRITTRSCGTTCNQAGVDIPGIRKNY